MTAENIVALLGINGSVIVAAFFILRWLLQRTVEAKIDVLKAQEIESFKVTLAQELESARHQLQLEHTKLSIVYENQKNSFSKVIQAMHRSITAIEQRYDSGFYEWRPIDERQLEEFRKVVMDESLFVGAEGQRALKLFLDCMEQAVIYPGISEPESRNVRHVHDALLFLSEQIREYFRSRIGLPTESTALFDIELFGACRLINQYYSVEAGFPTQGVLKMGEEQSASEFVSIAKANLEKLAEELERLIGQLKSSPDSGRGCFEMLSRAERYISTIQKSGDLGRH